MTKQTKSQKSKKQSASPQADIRVESLRLVVGTILIAIFAIGFSYYYSMLVSILFAIVLVSLFMFLLFESKRIASYINTALEACEKAVLYFLIKLVLAPLIYVLSYVIEIPIIIFSFFASGYDSRHLLRRMEEAFDGFRLSLGVSGTELKASVVLLSCACAIVMFAVLIVQVSTIPFGPYTAPYIYKNQTYNLTYTTSGLFHHSCYVSKVSQGSEVVPQAKSLEIVANLSTEIDVAGSTFYTTWNNGRCGWLYWANT